ncbi:hypothetical protein HK097_007194 [Rhizophlyctis rosea]|uniref:BRCT domain-containing protein n=1 Tax=Rhizophlyctis rosea TaxID=64517 RepID=A0AAD5X1S4_9FUNG|nr:hypothetical protein HK097_007194 [Rhizophlyctis rosea]
MSFPRQMIPFHHPEIGEEVRYDQTYHVNDHFLFLRTTRPCDECFQPIPAGHLASEGTREWWPDAPYQLTHPTTDIVHVNCYIRENDEDLSAQLHSEPHQIRGWSYLSPDEKRGFLIDTLKWDDEAKIAASVSIVPPWHGITVILCGEFDRGKDSVTAEIERLGGIVVQAVNGNTNLCILGRDGTTQYGQKTGKGSKKYKEVKKKKIAVVGIEWMEGASKQTEVNVADVVGRFKKGAVVEGPFDSQYGLVGAEEEVKAAGEGASGTADTGATTAEPSEHTTTSKKRTRKSAPAPSDDPPAKRVTRSRAKAES